MIEPLRPARVTDQLVDHLAASVVSGRLRPGQQVPSEAELVATFGISKVGVREAIGALAALGLVQVQQGKRTVVRDEQEWYVLSPIVQQALRREFGAAHVLAQLYEVRLILEPGVAALAAERAKTEAIDELRHVVTELTAIAGGTRDTRLFMRWDQQFHDAVARLAQNPSLRSMCAELNRHMLDNWADSRVVAADLPDLAGEHADVADAIASGDPAAAHAAMERHVLRARNVEVGRRVGHATGAAETAGP